jgi:hypothetical protein
VGDAGSRFMGERSERACGPGSDTIEEKINQAGADQRDEDKSEGPGETKAIHSFEKIQPPVSAGYEGLLFPPEQSEKIFVEILPQLSGHFK